MSNQIIVGFFSHKVTVKVSKTNQEKQQVSQSIMLDIQCKIDLIQIFFFKKAIFFYCCEHTYIYKLYTVKKQSKCKNEHNGIIKTIKLELIC